MIFFLIKNKINSILIFFYYFSTRILPFLSVMKSCERSSFSWQLENVDRYRSRRPKDCPTPKFLVCTVWWFEWKLSAFSPTCTVCSNLVRKLMISISLLKQVGMIPSQLHRKISANKKKNSSGIPHPHTPASKAVAPWRWWCSLCACWYTTGRWAMRCWW